MRNANRKCQGRLENNLRVQKNEQQMLVYEYLHTYTHPTTKMLGSSEQDYGEYKCGQIQLKVFL